MKKSGFTLSELLIALTVIAIASAMIAPAISNFMPDKNKTRILKYYSMVKNYTSDMLDNEGIYYAATDFDANSNMPTKTCEALNCTAQPLVHPYNDAVYSGTHKYRNLLMYMITGLKNDTQNNKTITLQDGSVWTITEVDSNDLTKGYTVTIDMNSGGDNCLYNASSCKKPDWFRFKVDQYGDVESGDALTAAFIKTPGRTSKKKDLADAEADTTQY